MKTAHNYIFDLPAHFGMDDLRGLVSGNYTLSEDPARQQQRHYLDTFDWRLFSGGSVLEVAQDSSGRNLTWRKLGSGEIQLLQSVPKLPRFASDFSAPAIRARMEAVTGVRALHPKVSVASKSTSLRLLNAEQKTIARLELRGDQILLPQSIKQISLPTRLYLFPYRGYAKAAATVMRALSGKYGLSPAREDPLVGALNAMGIQAGEYSSHLDYALTPEMSASVAVAHIQLKLLDQFQINLDGACQDLDSEFLHDLRSAASRAEFLLRKQPDVFAGIDTRRFREEFAWLEKVSRPTRQLDVYLLLLDEYKSRLPKGHGNYLEPFRSFLLDHKKSERRGLIVALQSPRYHRLAENWRGVLQQQLERPAAPGEHDVSALAASLVGPACQELLEQGRIIDKHTPATQLGGLHTACKELGFLLEFFRQLCPKKKLRQVEKPLNRLHDNLEEFEDLELQQQRLATYISQMREEQRLVQQASLEAMDLLIRDMARRETKVRKVFAKRFEKFASSECQTRFRKLFPRAPEPQEPADSEPGAQPDKSAQGLRQALQKIRFGEIPK